MSGKTLTDHSLFNSSLFWGIQYISIIVGLGWGNQTQKLKKNFDGSIELTWTTRFVHMFGQKQAKPRHKSGKTELWIQGYIYQKRTTNPPDIGRLLNLRGWKFRYFEFGFLSKRIKGQGRTHYYIYHGKQKMYIPTYIKRSKSIPFL